MLNLLQRETRKLVRAFLHPAFFYLFLVGNGILLAATTIVYALERTVNPRMASYFDSLWWGVSTITTVGFGDIVPITFPGRAIGIGLMYSGTVLFISFTGMLVTYWIRQEVERELSPLESEVLREVREQRRIEAILLDIQARLDRQERAGRGAEWPLDEIKNQPENERSSHESEARKS